jgi:Ni/Co efflux regulator RcnB
MKRILIAASAMLVALTGTAATAQSYGHDRHHDRRDSYERRYDDRRWDDRRDYRRDDRRDYRRWSRGDRLPSHYRGRGYYVDDYYRYGYREPPRGYRYYRTDTGDIVLAAIATGIIASVILNGN